MSPLAADVIGLIGSALFIGAFAYANIAKTLDKVWFNLANLAGAILLLLSLWVHFNLANLAGAILLLVSLSVTFNLAAFVLEAAWAAIALFGIVAALRERARAQ